jgi:transcriptional regulator with XRE-family HTH domain
MSPMSPMSINYSLHEAPSCQAHESFGNVGKTRNLPIWQVLYFFCECPFFLTYGHGSALPGRPATFMASRIHSYLRTHRKRCGLTQDEVAFLLGCQTGTKVSRFERRARKPNLATALACEVVFGVPAHELFPRAHAEVEKSVTERARLLASRLRAGSNRQPARLRQKLASLNAIAERERAAAAR